MKKLYCSRYSSEIIGVDTTSAFIGTGVLVSSFLFYVLTLAPTVIWGDSAAYALQAMEMRLTVGADSHPLFILLGHLFSYLPFEVAYSLNLLSAVSASLAVLMVYLIVLEITGSRISAIVGAASLALSHAFWLHAVMAEVYDLNAFFVVLIMLILLKWREQPKNLLLLYFAALLFGLGLSNHLVMILAAFGYLFFVLINDWRILLRLKVLLITIGSFLVGSSILIYLSLQKLASGRTVPALVDAATGGQAKKAMLSLSLDIFRDMLMYLSYLFYQFPLVGFLLGSIGIFALLRKDRVTAISLLLLIGVNAAFFVSFGPGVKRTTKYTFYILDYAVFSILIGYGFFVSLGWLGNRGYPLKTVIAVGITLVILLPLLLYNITPYTSRSLGIDLLHARTIPYRDNETFFLNPSKRGYTGAAKYAEQALNTASPNSIIIADYTPSTVLEYFQHVYGLRRDVLLLDSGGARENIPKRVVSTYYGRRDIYLADMERGYYRIGPLKDEYDFVPEGVLYRVVRKPTNLIH